MSVERLNHVAKLNHARFPYLALVSEWKQKRRSLILQQADIPELIAAYRERHVEPHKSKPSVSWIDDRPRLRLAIACDAVAAAIYSIAEIAASFANRCSRGYFPASFNKLRNKLEAGAFPELLGPLGDLSWYRRAREARTEWTHHSSIFIGDDGGSPVFVIRAYRRRKDREEFRNHTVCSIAELEAWATLALSSLDRFADHLLSNHVLPRFDLREIVHLPMIDSDGTPRFVPGTHTFQTEAISIAEYVRRAGVKISSEHGEQEEGLNSDAQTSV